MPLRALVPEDIPLLAELYRESARGLAAHVYSAEQIQVWASFPDDYATFEARLRQGAARVSVVDNAIASFGQLDPANHVALLYTAPRFARQGHATAIYLALEALARAQGVTHLTTTASHLSRPLFAKHGFTLVEVEDTTYQGVRFNRFKMEKNLSPDS